MAFDAFYLGAVLRELEEKLSGARVEKIHQPSRDTVLMHLKTREGREKLLFAPNPAAPRLHLTASSPENPDVPPMFCMLLRKHLSGARLAEISQPAMERCAVFTFDCTDELGDRVQKKLVAELMGRTCNLYLLGADGRILDCLRRIGLDETSKRPALPGMFYQMPDPVEKQDPRTVESFEKLLTESGADGIADRLMDVLGGLSPLVCREAALYAAGDTDARISACDPGIVGEKLEKFFHTHLNDPKPYYYQDLSGKPKQFAFCPMTQYGAVRQGASFGEVMDLFYVARQKREMMEQKSQSVRKTVQNLCQRLQRKMAIQEKELQETYDRERLRQLGDILTANLHKMKKGQTVVSVEDFYDENMALIEVPLSPTLSPQENAAKYYKNYSRMKNAEKELTRQLEIGRQEKAYLESVLEELRRVGTDAELEEIRQELQEGGYLKKDAGKKRQKAGKLPPMRFVSTDGYPIYVGRNNRQNEELTFKSARKDDLWLHASKVHGSHVIIDCGGTNPPDDTVTQAAQLAAHYAETTGGQNIPVDVTQVRQVKKVPGGKPGMVIYHSYRTAIVNPYPDIVVDELNAEKKSED